MRGGGGGNGAGEERFRHFATSSLQEGKPIIDQSRGPSIGGRRNPSHPRACALPCEPV